MGIRLGIIGTGRIAGRAVTEIRECDGIAITVAVNPNIDHARNFAEINDIPGYAADMEELRGKADVAYVASPHGTHFEYALNLLKMGIHVICEKPALLGRKQADAIQTAASENGAVFMEGIKTAWCPGFKMIEDIVASGKIGRVVDVEAAFTRLTPPDCREYKDKQYGGAFTEFGTYTILPILRFLGTEGYDVRFLKCYAEGVDGYTKAVFDYGDRFGCAKTGLSVKSEGQLVIAGTKGYILVPSPWWLTRYFEVRYEDPSKIERFDCEFAGDGLRYEFAEFVRRINGGLSMSGKEAAEMKARAAIYEAFLSGRECDLR